MTPAQGCRTGPPAYVAWRAGTDSLYLPFSMTRSSKSENTKVIICTTIAGKKAQLKLKV